MFLTHHWHSYKLDLVVFLNHICFFSPRKLLVYLPIILIILHSVKVTNPSLTIYTLKLMSFLPIVWELYILDSWCFKPIIEILVLKYNDVSQLKSNWVYQGNAIITHCRPTHNTKRHTTLTASSHQEDKWSKANSSFFLRKIIEKRVRHLVLHNKTMSKHKTPTSYESNNSKKSTTTEPLS